MYRILISDDIIGKAKKYAAKLKRQKIDEKLKNLCLIPKNQKLNLQPYVDYINEIASNYEQILCLLPSEFENFEKTHFSKYTVNLKEKFLNKNGKDVSFFEIIVYYMGYSDIAREKILPYLKEIGFNVCVYCNATKLDYTKENGVLTQKGTLDHYFDKASHPFLCTSFFNLFPCCSVCNGRGMKANRDIEFYPYVEQGQNNCVNPFEFSFKIKDIGKNCSDEKNIEIGFVEKEWMGGKSLYRNEKRKKSYGNIFKIKKRYDERKELVCDVLNDNRFQNFWQNRTAPSVSGRRLKPVPEVQQRVNILRVHSLKYEDVHKRALMKFLLDLGKCLKLVP